MENSTAFTETRLDPNHKAMLCGQSAISAEVLDERGYFTARTPDELEALGFADYQRNTPALVLPIHNVDGEITLHTIRPDEPRRGDSGKPRKYEFPKGCRMVMDVPPQARQYIADPSVPLLITEGIKKEDSLISHGARCVIGLLGIWTWRGTNEHGGLTALADWESIALKGREVFIVFDSDIMAKESVHASMMRLKKFLESKGAKVSIIYLPGGENGEKVGVDDYLAAGHTLADLKNLAGPLKRLPAANKKRNQADRLIDYALDSGAGLFVDQVGAPHVLVSGEALPLGTRSYNWLRSLMWEEEEISVGGEALKTAAGTLAAFAAKSGRVRELHTRSAFHGGAVYYQLRPGRVVRIDRGGWNLEDDPPVVFRSVPNLKPLPDPQPGGTLDTLEDLINLKGERDVRMCKAYAATLPLPHIPRPILQTTGVMGSGKTTAGRVIKRLLDPTAPETVRFDPRDFLQKASHSYIVMADNINSIPEWGVDTLCRLVTGEADSKRSLYTDDEDFIYEMLRAVLLNGINAPTERGDAQDRTLPVELERIPDRQRRSEEDLWAEFEREHSRLLGAVFDVLSKALRQRETLRLHRRPRLADWGEYAAAVYEVMGWGVRQFLEDWGEVVKVQNMGTLDGSPVAQAILSFMESRNKWSGLASDLHAKLEVEAEELNIDIKRDKMWPKSPSWLWRRMREVLPLLVAMGVEADKHDGETGSIIQLVRTPSGPDRGDEDKDPGDEDNPGSTEGDASRNASRENSAYSSGSESTGSTGGNRGHSSSTRTQTGEEKAENQTEKGAEKDTGRKVHRDASSASSGPSDNSVSSVSSVSEELSPLSSDLQPGESATLEELRARRTRETSRPSAETSPVEELLKNPPGWLSGQLVKCRENPERWTKPTCSSIAHKVYGTATRWHEVKPVLEAFLAKLGDA
jgi:hypothetical protein